MMYSFIGLHYELDHIKNNPWRRFKSLLQVFRKYFSRNMTRKKTYEQGMPQQINSSKSRSQNLRKWSTTSQQSKISFTGNELFSDSEDNSIFNLDLLDDQTAEKQVMDSYPLSREPEYLKTQDSEQSKNEMSCPKMFCSGAAQKTEDTFGIKTNHMDVESKQERFTKVSSRPLTSTIFTGIFTRSSFPSIREMQSSFMNSSDMSGFNRPHCETMVTDGLREEDFKDVRTKCCLDRNYDLESLSVSPERILFTLKYTICKDPVLILNSNLISTTVEKEEAMGLSLIPTEVSSCHDRLYYETHDLRAFCSQTGKNELIPHSTCGEQANFISSNGNQAAINKYCCKREKNELRKQLSKQLYVFLGKDGMSKKKYHQKTRQASLRYLVEAFFKNYNEMEKKDNNGISKIINHLFKYLSLSSTPSSALFPVGRNTPSTLEAFFQQILHIDNQNESEGDTMHVEWMRLQTFSSFPASCKVSTVHLARDGFYYTGRSTEAQCFSCRNTYRDWDETSNINAIHLEISPDCDMANGRSERNIAIHDPHRYQERLADSSPPQRTEDGATGQSSSLDTTQEQPAVTTVEEDKEPSKFGSFGILRHQTFFI